MESGEIYTPILPRFKKENSDTCYNRDEDIVS